MAVPENYLGRAVGTAFLYQREECQAFITIVPVEFNSHRRAIVLFLSPIRLRLLRNKTGDSDAGFYLGRELDLDYGRGFLDQKERMTGKKYSIWIYPPLFTAAVFCVLCFLPAHAAEMFTAKEQQTLEWGGVLLRTIPEKRPGQTTEGRILIEAEPRLIFEVLADAAKYPEFMPNLKEVRVLEKSARQIRADYTIELPFGKWRKYRLLMYLRDAAGGYEISWKKENSPELSEGQTIRNTQGFWRFEDYPRKKGWTLVIYHVYNDPAPVPWGMTWIVNDFNHKIVPQILYKLKARLDATAHYESKHA